MVADLDAHAPRAWDPRRLILGTGLLGVRHRDGNTTNVEAFSKVDLKGWGEV